jgi:fido (protein-threonine AMPylation protein)
MASLNEKLADSAKELRRVGEGGKRRVFKTREIGRTHRERLVEHGFLREIINGWLMVARPEDKPGDTTSWYASFWEFARQYLTDRFAAEWILSPETSVPLLADDLNVPPQIVVQSPRASNRTVQLPHGTSIFAYRTALPEIAAAEANGLKVYPAPEALVAAAPALWTADKPNVIALLGALRGTAPLLAPLLRGGHSAAAGRIAGALRALGRSAAADEIVDTMRRASHVVRETDPFQGPVPLHFAGARPTSPIVTRIKLMWAEMREGVLQEFKAEPRRINDREGYLASVDERYAADAYHSLSIEGYQVSEELIERVRTGRWDPANVDGDRQQTDAMAARGYWLAFQEVRKAVARILDGEDAAVVVEAELQNWYRAMFEPSVAAGLLRPERLAGYRAHFVFIRDSAHVPVSWEVLPDAMETFFECLRTETDPRVRAVLGHFVFTFIHPLPDGNGRCGRFILNAMLASGGFPWTIIPVDRRTEYMQALEGASVRRNVRPFAGLVAELVRLDPPPPGPSRVPVADARS